jgi:hypothetical protein
VLEIAAASLQGSPIGKQVSTYVAAVAPAASSRAGSTLDSSTPRHVVDGLGRAVLAPGGEWVRDQPIARQPPREPVHDVD